MSAAIQKDPTETRWTKIAQSALLNRTIKNVRYMTQEEADHFGWDSRAVVLELDNGHLLWPSRDDEGNDAGAIFTTDERADTLPVLR
jgi:hypothetical protein